jgi:hypothetical protein
MQRHSEWCELMRAWTFISRRDGDVTLTAHCPRIHLIKTNRPESLRMDLAFWRTSAHLVNVKIDPKSGSSNSKSQQKICKL